MANLGYQFDAEGIEPQKSFEPLPVGKYECIVTNSDVKRTQDGGGSYIWLELTVCDNGPYHGRKIFTNITLTNSGPKAQQAMEIGQKQLSGLCHAAGKLKIEDTSELHDIPIVVDVKIKKDQSGQYGDKNEVRAFLKPGEQDKPKPPSNGSAPARQPAMSGASNGGGKPPWVKK